MMQPWCKPTQNTLKQQNQNIRCAMSISFSSKVSRTNVLLQLFVVCWPNHSAEIELDLHTIQNSPTSAFRSPHHPPHLTSLVLLPDYLVESPIFNTDTTIHRILYPQDLLLGGTSALCGERGLAWRRYIVDLPKFEIRDYGKTQRWNLVLLRLEKGWEKQTACTYYAGGEHETFASWGRKEEPKRGEHMYYLLSLMQELILQSLQEVVLGIRVPMEVVIHRSLVEWRECKIGDWRWRQMKSWRIAELRNGRKIQYNVR